MFQSSVDPGEASVCYVPVRPRPSIICKLDSISRAWWILSVEVFLFAHTNHCAGSGDIGSGQACPRPFSSHRVETEKLQSINECLRYTGGGIVVCAQEYTEDVEKGVTRLE